MVRKAALVVMMVVGITVLIWAGVHNARDRRLAQQAEDDKKTMQVRMASEAKQSSGEAGDGTEANLTGKVAPGFTLVDLDGRKVSLADYKGKPVMVNFWATWCGPCKEEMPWLEEFHTKYAADGFVILGVTSDEVPKALVASTVKKLGVTYPILLTDSKVEKPYGGVEGLPESFYVDRGGKVLIETAGIHDGEGGKDEVEANIKKLIASGGK